MAHTMVGRSAPTANQGRIITGFAALRVSDGTPDQLGESTLIIDQLRGTSRA